MNKRGGRRKDLPVPLLSLLAISFRVHVILSLEYPTSLDTLAVFVAFHVTLCSAFRAERRAAPRRALTGVYVASGFRAEEKKVKANATKLLLSDEKRVSCQTYASPATNAKRERKKEKKETSV